MNIIQERERRTQHFIHSAVFLKEIHNIVDFLKEIKNHYLVVLKELPNYPKSSISIREIEDLIKKHKDNSVYVLVLLQIRDYIKQQNSNYYKQQQLKEYCKENIKLLKKRIRKLQRLYKDIRDNREINLKEFSFLQEKSDLIRVSHFKGFITFNSRVKHILKCLTLL